MLNVRVLTLLTMILAAAATRLIPPELRPWNFTAVGAMCLFGGAYFERRWLAFAAPLAALLVSDIVLAATVYGFDSLTHVWMSYVLFGFTVLIGMTLRDRVSLLRVTFATIAASLMFFVVSNFHAWIVGHGGYPYTPAGLMACYIAAIPFAQNMLLGNLFFSTVLFGGYELLARNWPALREPALARVRA